jgi:hypothetical protein
MQGTQSVPADRHDVSLDAGDIVPGAMYGLLFIVALWRLFVHRPSVCTVTEWPAKFGFHGFVLCFAVRALLRRRWCRPISECDVVDSLIDMAARWR